MLKKIVRVVLKGIAFIVLFLLLISVALIFVIRIPAVQNKVIHAATHFISDKTHTVVSVGEIGIRFPKSVYLKDIYLEDKNNDTLLSASSLHVNLDLLGLIRSSIHIHSVELEHASAFISRQQGDSVFNFDFLIRAFSGKKKQVSTDTIKSNLHFQCDEIRLNQIVFHYLDSFEQVMVKASIYDLHVTTEKTDINSLDFKVNDFILQNANIAVSIPENVIREKKKAPSKSNLLVAVNGLQLMNTSFTFDQGPDSIALSVLNINLKLTDALADINNNAYSAEFVRLNDCKTSFHKNKLVSNSANDSPNGKPGEMKINVNEIQFSNNYFSYNDNSKLPTTPGFDPAHFKLKNIHTDLLQAEYRNGEVIARLDTLAMTDQNGFELKNVSGNIAFLDTGIRIDNLRLQTVFSSINGNFNIGYHAIGELKDSLANVSVLVNMKTSAIHSSDLIYFVPSLEEAPYLSANTATVIEAKAEGQIGSLRIQTLNIHAGSQTTFHTSCTITGLPDFRHAELNMPEGLLNTTEKDLIAFLPKGTIPETIDLPEMIHTTIAFNGSMQNFKSQIGLDCDFGNIHGTLELTDKNAYTAEVELLHFNAGTLLRKSDIMGVMSLSVHAKGSGFSKDSLRALVSLHGDEISFNNYTYHNLDVEAIIERQFYDFTIGLRDTSIRLNLAGKVDLNSETESYKLNGTITGINLLNLNFSKMDVRLAADLHFDLRRNNITHYLSGDAEITNMSVVNSTGKYFIDTPIVLAINKGEIENTYRSKALAALYINGEIDPIGLPASFISMVNANFYLTPADSGKRHQDFEFRFQLNNHPVFQGALLKDLKAFEAGEWNGSFQSRKGLFTMNVDLSKLQYQSVDVSDARIAVSTDSSGLKFLVSVDHLESDPVKMNSLNLNTLLHNQQADISLTTGKETDDNMLDIHATVYNEARSGYKVNFANPLMINNLVWNIPADNALVIAKQYMTFHHMEIKNKEQLISINKEGVEDDLHFKFSQFELGSITRTLNKDTLLAEGLLGGDLKVNQDGSMVADLRIENFKVKSQLVGNFEMTAASLGKNLYSISTTLTGNENDVEIKGNVSVAKENQSLDLIADIREVNLKSIEPFTMGQLHESSGFIKGKLTITGTPAIPIILGGIDFINVSTIPDFTNNRIHLKSEHIDITDDAIRFPSFVIRDNDDHTATLNGEIRKKGFTDFKFDLGFVTKDFIFLNTTKKDNEVFFGNLLADCNANLTGDLTIPRIHADIRVHKGTHFTFVVQQNQSSTDKGEGIILFTDSSKWNPILSIYTKSHMPEPAMKGMDISANIIIDPEAVLTVLIDPMTGDSLSVRGDAALSFALDEGGKVSLTGRYELTDGSYLVTLQQFIHKKFSITKGSSITWNGDPLDAEVDLNAVYKVYTSPADLIANEVGAVSEEELRSYRQRLPFEVNLILKDKLLTPDISFSIELPQEFRGAMGGIVNSKLNLLKEDPSELNKQVFALLMLNRFIQQDPFTSASGSGAESVARTSVGKFLSQQLNNLSAQYIKGVELNVDVQSYENGTDASASGTTEVELGVKKEFFNERLSVQVGGTIDVEGAAQKNNQSGDLSGNVIIEYKLTPDGRYRLKGFRQNEYEGFIDGQLTETGVGIIYSRDFGKWREISSPPRKDDEK